MEHTGSRSPGHTHEGLAFPGAEPGPASGCLAQGTMRLENRALSCTWRLEDKRLRVESCLDRLGGTELDLRGRECFSLVLGDSPCPQRIVWPASQLVAALPAKLIELKGDPRAARLADRHAGLALTVELMSSDHQLHVTWQATLRDGANYLRQTVTIAAIDELMELEEVVLWELVLAGAEVAGSVDGSPVVAGNLFCGVEHPRSRNTVEGDPAIVRCSWPALPGVSPKAPLQVSGIIGAAPPGQLRRGFLYYLERERSQPYRPLLHYNNGSEIGCRYWQRRLHGEAGEAEAFRSEQQQHWLAAIAAFGEQLVKQRGVRMDAFAHDFEWDDETTVWQFHEGYPEGFTPARQEAAKCGAKLGVWFSPMGGYPGKAARVEHGARQGLETNPRGLSLAGPTYYARFRAACVEMMRKYGVCYFKFDGFGAGNGQEGAGAYASDVDALLRVIADLRAVEATVFVNPSTGSWPSPFWLLHADCIWRQGSDTAEVGKGSERQRWITYRDGQMLHGTLDRGPLFPLSSLMIHGIFVNSLPLFANPYDPASAPPTHDTAEIISEIRSFFGAGVNLQELYIDPELMTEATWTALADTAKWARENSDVLADTHWVGGDPEQGEVYGWASWCPRKGILTLRNPDDQPRCLSLDIGVAFELPEGSASSYRLRPLWVEGEASLLELAAGEPHAFELQPFEVLMFETS